MLTLLQWILLIYFNMVTVVLYVMELTGVLYVITFSLPNIHYSTNLIV